MKKEHFLIRKLRPAGIMIFILILCASVVSGQANFTEDENLKSNQKRSDNPLLKISDDKKNWQAIPAPKFAKPTGKLSSSDLTRVVEYDIVARTVKQSEFLESKIKTSGEIASNLAQSYGIYQPNEPIETIFPPDNRIKISPTVDFPWRTICKLYVTFPDGNHFVGSGVLVGRSDGIGFHCITAAHCVYRNEYGGYASKVEVIPALDNDYTPFYSAWAEKIRTPEGWTNNSLAEFDWACLTLDRQIGNFTGWMSVFTTPELSWYQRNFRCAGYPIDLDFGLCLYYDSDSGKFADDNFLYYNMDASAGQDGMPVWAKDGNTRKIVSIHIGEADGVGGNRGLRINAEKFSQLNQWINGDPAPIDLPDLVDDGPKWSNFKPGIVVRGFNQFNVWNDVRNIGTAPSTPLTVAFYASLDPVIDAKTDFLIGTTEIESLPPFAWRDSNWSGIFPEAIPAGEYYIGWIIDSENQVMEFNESNNLAFITSKKLLVKDPYIEILKPNGGEAFASGEQNYIEWFTAAGSGLVTIDVSYNNGISWQNLVTNIPDSGRYGWNILPSQAPVFSCLIKVTDTGKNLTDLSDTPFVIDTRPTIPGIPYADRAWTNTPGVLFKWTSANDPETGIAAYHVQIGTTPNSNDIADTLIGNVLNFNAIGTHNQKLYAKVRAKNGVGLESLWSASSKGILIDLTPPILQGGPFDEGEFSGKDSVLFTWNPATDEESGIIMNYKLQVGTAIGLNDVFDKWINRKLEYKVVGKHGQTLYARIKVHNAAIGVSDWSDWSDGITIDLTPPTAPGKPYSDELTFGVLNIPLSWNQATDDQSGVIDHRLKVLDVTANNQVVFDEWVGGVLQYSVPVNNEHTYIALVQAKNGAGLVGNWSLTSEPISIKRNPITLILIDYSSTYPGDDWPNAIDKITEGWQGTVSAKTYKDKKPYAIFSAVGEDTFNIDKIRLLTDTGVGWESRWVTHFRILYSLTGTNEADFIELINAEKHGGEWEEYTFPEQLVRYIKLVLDLPERSTAEFAQVGEFEVYGNFITGKLLKADLQLHSGTPTWPNEEWTNAIDNDLEGWDGTVSATALHQGGIRPSGIFTFSDSSTYKIAKVRLLTDTGVNYWQHWIKRFRLDVSTTGTRDEDFITVYEDKKTDGGWESFYFIPVMAKYMKLVLLETNVPFQGYYQIGEFEVYKSETMYQSVANLNKNLGDQLNMQNHIDLPQAFYIAQNYPNPFNPETTIQFQLPVDSQVILKIYNMMGQEITTLVDGLLSAGNHSIMWNGRNNHSKKVPSGMYLYQFRAGNYNVTKKMVLLE